MLDHDATNVKGEDHGGIGTDSSKVDFMATGHSLSDFQRDIPYCLE